MFWIVSNTKWNERPWWNSRCDNFFLCYHAPVKCYIVGARATITGNTSSEIIHHFRDPILQEEMLARAEEIARLEGVILRLER